MAGTTQRVTRSSGIGDFDELYQMRLALNKLVDDIEVLRAGLDAICDILDADAGVTATNLATTAAVATAVTMTAPKVLSHDE